MHSARLLVFCRFSIVLVMISICAGNITNSFLLKWSFRDDQKGDFSRSYSLVGMMAGEAPKPYVYRSALARASKALAERLPAETRDKLHRSILRYDSLHKAYFRGVPDGIWTPVVSIAYHLVYLAIVLSTALSLLLIYRLARLNSLTFAQALSFVVAASLIYPLTFQQGGYYYDFLELLGALLACYLTLKRQPFLATVAVAVFSLNKETFFLVPLALFFLRDRGDSLLRRCAWTMCQLAACFATRQIIMSGYEGNAGGMVEFHLVDNLLFWLNPKSWLGFYNLVGKGILTPSLQNPLLLVPLVAFFREAWRLAPNPYRAYLVAAVGSVLPLFLLFGFHDEARNFSTAFPSIVLIALCGATSFGRIFEGPSRNNAAGLASPSASDERP